MSTETPRAQKRIARTPRSALVAVVPAISLRNLETFEQYSAAHDCAVAAVLAACPEC